MQRVEIGEGAEAAYIVAVPGAPKASDVLAVRRPPANPFFTLA